MSFMSYPKQYRGGTNPVGPVRPHIYRDPPKSITTRKKETVSVADVLYMVQSDTPNGDPTRINESIQMYARGQNPMVDISYTNMGGAQTNTSLGNFQSHNPYKVEVVRPPITPLELLQPISAPRMHQNYTVRSNPGIAPISIAGNIDNAQVKDAIVEDVTSSGQLRINPSLASFDNNDILHRENFHSNRITLDGVLRNNPSLPLQNTNSSTTVETNKITLDGSIRPTASINIDLTRDMSDFSGHGIQHSNVYSVNSNITLNTNEFDMRQLNSMDPHDPVHAKILQMPYSTNISLREHFNLDNQLMDQSSQQTRLMRDYQVMPVNSSVSFNELVHIDGQIRNGEITNSAIKDMAAIGVTSNPTFSNIVIYDPKTNTALDVSANVKEKNYIAVNAALGMPLMVNTNDGKQIVLKDYQYSVVQPNIGNSQLLIQVAQPDVQLERNTPLFAATTNILYNNYDGDSSRLTQGQHKLDRISDFGGYTDRISRNAGVRTMIQPNGIGKKDKFITV